MSTANICQKCQLQQLPVIVLPVLSSISFLCELNLICVLVNIVGNRLAGVLDKLGLTASSMSESGKASLATVSGAALSLDVKDTSDTRYVQSSMRLVKNSGLLSIKSIAICLNSMVHLMMTMQASNLGSLRARPVGLDF